jgi:oxygen-independent coproporphyrinogen-3 oxidase
LAPVGFYIHVPFCRARCAYCDFVSFAGQDVLLDRYVADLCEEIRLQALLAPLPPSVSTVFFGGGTPSLLESHHVEQILKTVRTHFSLDQGTEITFEANPESVTPSKASGWRMAGVNRLSLGLQAWDDALLRTLGRLHTVEIFRRAYAIARKAGFENVNVDLLYGLPGQTSASWQETLGSTVALHPDHVSLYALTIERHTPLATQGLEVDDDLQAEMYDSARSFLGGSGYRHYEISNFCRPGMECRHNLIYWRQQDYFGVGVGAVGCVNGRRWENHRTLEAYHTDLKEGRLPRDREEKLGPAERRFEHLMLGLRLREGMEWASDTPGEWLEHRSRLAARGLLEEVRPGTWRIPDHAVLLTNQALLPFVP